MIHDFFTELTKLASDGKWLPMKEKQLSLQECTREEYVPAQAKDDQRCE